MNENGPSTANWLAIHRQYSEMIEAICRSAIELEVWEMPAKAFGGFAQFKEKFQAAGTGRFESVKSNVSRSWST